MGRLDQPPHRGAGSERSPRTFAYPRVAAQRRDCGPIVSNQAGGDRSGPVAAGPDLRPYSDTPPATNARGQPSEGLVSRGGTAATARAIPAPQTGLRAWRDGGLATTAEDPGLVGLRFAQTHRPGQHRYGSAPAASRTGADRDKGASMSDSDASWEPATTRVSSNAA